VRCLDACPAGQFISSEYRIYREAEKVMRDAVTLVPQLDVGKKALSTSSKRKAPAPDAKKAAKKAAKKLPAKKKKPDKVFRQGSRRSSRASPCSPTAGGAREVRRPQLPSPLGFFGLGVSHLASHVRPSLELVSVAGSRGARR
jgi:hypothetical protein